MFSGQLRRFETWTRKQRSIWLLAGAAVVCALAFLPVGCRHLEQQEGYVVTRSDRLKYQHVGDSQACGPQMDCDREEFRYTMVHNRVKYVVHCGSYSEDVNDCFRIQVGEVYQCKFGAAFGDQWLDCGKYHLDLDSAEKF